MHTLQYMREYADTRSHMLIHVLVHAHAHTHTHTRTHTHAHTHTRTHTHTHVQLAQPMPLPTPATRSPYRRLFPSQPNSATKRDGSSGSGSRDGTHAGAAAGSSGDETCLPAEAGSGASRAPKDLPAPGSLTLPLPPCLPDGTLQPTPTPIPSTSTQDTPCTATPPAAAAPIADAGAADAPSSDHAAGAGKGCEGGHSARSSCSGSRSSSSSSSSSSSGDHLAASVFPYSRQGSQAMQAAVAAAGTAPADDAAAAATHRAPLTMLMPQPLQRSRSPQLLMGQVRWRRCAGAHTPWAELGWGVFLHTCVWARAHACVYERPSGRSCARADVCGVELPAQLQGGVTHCAAPACLLAASHALFGSVASCAAPRRGLPPTCV